MRKKLYRITTAKVKAYVIAADPTAASKKLEDVLKTTPYLPADREILGIEVVATEPATPAKGEDPKIEPDRTLLI